MKARFWLFLGLMAPFVVLKSQFDFEDFELRFGYNIHNAQAKRFNSLIETFNNDRFPMVISENLPSINFLRGFTFGAGYRFRDDMILYANLKNKHKFIESKFIENGKYYQFHFRENTLEAGITFPIGEEKSFTHFASGGIYFGYMSVFSDWSLEGGFTGTKSMLNIDHTNVFGLSLSYEARIKLHEYGSIFVRPLAQYALRSYVRNLTSFMNPEIQGNEVHYQPLADEKYNNGSLGGLGIEAGIIIRIPPINR